MESKLLTVFTPTYNRAYLLPQLYHSLINQTCKEFIWLVIDDGSLDYTKELVQTWIDQKKISIKYVYKENGGMHSAHNMAYDLITTELNVCIDSDDYMPNDAIENILRLWSKKGNDELAGIIGLDAKEDGSIVGTPIPKHLAKGTLPDLYSLHKVKGDKKIILRTTVVNKYPRYPEFKGEKLVPLGILYLQIAQDYECLYSNDVYCVVDYQEGGSSKTIFKQYKQSPNGFAYARKIHIKLDRLFKDRVRAYIHLISSSIFSKNIRSAFKDVNPVVTFIFFPFGIILNFYIRLINNLKL